MAQPCHQHSFQGVQTKCSARNDLQHHSFRQKLQQFFCSLTVPLASFFQHCTHQVGSNLGVGVIQEWRLPFLLPMSGNLAQQGHLFCLEECWPTCTYEPTCEQPAIKMKANKH